MCAAVQLQLVLLLLLRLSNQELGLIIAPDSLMLIEQLKGILARLYQIADDSKYCDIVAKWNNQGTFSEDWMRGFYSTRVCLQKMNFDALLYRGLAKV